MVPSDAFSSTTRPGSGCCDADTGVALGVAVLFASCPRATAAKVVSANDRKVRICFIIVSLARRSYSNTSHGRTANSLECVHRVIVKEEAGARRNLCDLDGACPERGQIGERPIR